MGFPRQGYWRGLPIPSPGGLPNSGIESGSPAYSTAKILYYNSSLQIFFGDQECAIQINLRTVDINKARQMLSVLLFTPHTILLGLLLCPWTWGIFLVGINILLTVAQQQVVILEFLQEKMSARGSTLPKMFKLPHNCTHFTC